MTQHNLTQILKVIRDLVMRNRPCYRDYLGSETVTKTVQIGSGMFEDDKGDVYANILIEDPSFSGFILGETYTVSIDGVTADYVARNFSPISEDMGPIIGTITTFNTEYLTFDGWICIGGRNPAGKVSCTAQTYDMSFVGKTISISKTKTETVRRYKTQLLPEYLLPAFLRKNVVANKAEVQSAVANAVAAADNAQTAADNAQTAADNAQTTADNANTAAGIAQSLAYAKFQLMKQTTVKTTTTIGTIRNSIGSVNVKGLNIAVGSIIKFTADGNVSGSAVWDRPEKVIDIKNTHGATICNLDLSLLHDGQTYSFTNQTAGSILSNLVIEYEKVIIPTSAFTSRMEGAWLPPYLIANCLYLTKASTTSTSAKLYRITVDDTGTLKATEVTS